MWTLIAHVNVANTCFLIYGQYCSVGCSDSAACGAVASLRVQGRREVYGVYRPGDFKSDQVVISIIIACSALELAAGEIIVSGTDTLKPGGFFI